MLLFYYLELLEYNKIIINKAEKVPFMRDIIFNAVAIVLLMIFAFIGQINHYMAIGFCSLYIFYIIVVLLNERTIK